ncbi:MAG: tRNA uridine-5-carboxymethylaminomethyl(34) synthesis GTPase MnmE [Oscillospiraceae bacterium]|jgi:tRNA modification GTPase|nr:tRNA uridine-5-carboxymethylaminomethyl(34) synthesis GTPase MnmE [Oscillospiraceae bacterium]
MPEPHTIAAIATAHGPGGVGVVRMSGPAAIIIADQLFFAKNNSNLSQLRGYTMTYGTIHSLPSAGKRRLDEAICLVFRAPHSYTGEDVVEFQCHGGAQVLRQVLQAVLDAGARPAEPGEFTRRAYLNGRIDLAKAEAVMQLVTAQSGQAARAAASAMGGALSRAIEEIRQSLIPLVARIAAWVDYPEEEFDDPQQDQIAAVLAESAVRLSELLRRSAADQAVLFGLDTAIIGPPNAGKSSLMNLLAGYDRSIVTELPGTTRDTVTETVQLGNVTLRLVDTAGLRDTDHPIERIGVARSKTALANADLLFAVFDATQPPDLSLLAPCDPARTIVIFNKIDLLPSTPPPLPDWKTVSMSAREGVGLEALTAAVESLYQTANFSPDEAILANRRQAQAAQIALAALQEASFALAEGYALDAVSVCMEDAIQALYQLTGERASEHIVDEVFRNFCVGK